MRNWLKFLEKDEQNTQASLLQKKIHTIFPDLNPELQVLYACYSGVLAKVAYADLKINHREISKMKNILMHFTKLDELAVDTIIHIAKESMEELSGIEDHRYTQGLRENLSEDERSQLLISLFALAAADQEVSSDEVEAIRNITTGLNLSHQHFIAAKAKVKDYLTALKRD